MDRQEPCCDRSDKAEPCQGKRTLTFTLDKEGARANFVGYGTYEVVRRLDEADG